jgi:hypothetical protein
MSPDNPTATPLLRTITEAVTRRLRITTHANMGMCKVRIGPHLPETVENCCQCHYRHGVTPRTRLFCSECDPTTRPRQMICGSYLTKEEGSQDRQQAYGLLTTVNGQSKRVCDGLPFFALPSLEVNRGCYNRGQCTAEILSMLPNSTTVFSST